MMGNKAIYIYDRNHTKLDEISFFSGLKYGWTLNDVDTCEFSLALSNNKCTEANTTYFNHVEVWDESTNTAVWGGILAGRDFEDVNLKLNCLSYEALFRWRRMRYKDYGEMTYGALTEEMVDDTNAIEDTGVSIGTITSGSIKTTRIIEETDMLLEKLKALCADANYDWEIDLDRQYNFYLRKGSDKPHYELIWGGDGDNILAAPSRAEDVLSMANAVYSETDTLDTLVEDATSQGLYGLVEGIFSANEGVSVQATLNAQASGELQRTAYPVNTLTIAAKDSQLCPFSGIIVGDSVTVKLIPYFDFSAQMRIIRMVHDEDTNTRDVTFGTCILRPAAPTKRLYKIVG
jgi:hypothetical protein